jgi:D-aminoacyl-tRNA deacylase
MRVVIQRVSAASVQVGSVEVAAISAGLMVLVGIEDVDNEEDISWISHKIVQLRVFNDDQGIMNRSVLDIGGELLLVSQFTLFANTKKGNRPSYIRASKPTVAVPLYEALISSLNHLMGIPVKTGVFGADMQLALVNDGPVTILIDSKNRE